MIVAASTSARARWLDLATVASRCKLQRPARLYATVLDARGRHGRRYFMASLPSGTAVLRLAAEGVTFLLVEGEASTAEPLLASG